MEQSDAGGFTDPAPPPPDESVAPVRRPRKAPAKQAQATSPEPAKAPGKAAASKASKNTAAKTPAASAEAATPTKKAAPANKAAPAEKATPAKKAAPAKKTVPAKASATKIANATATVESPTPPTEAQPPLPPAPTPLAPLELKPSNGRKPARPEAVQPVPAAQRDPRVRLMERAVQDLGPSAEDWLERTRRRYPDAGRDALARLAAWDYGRMARRRAVATGAARFVGPIAATGPLTRLRIEVVLVIAGVHGRASRHLAGDLVALLPMRTPRAAVAPIAGLAARALAAHVIPFGGAVVAAVQARAIEDVAARAHGYYKGHSPAT